MLALSFASCVTLGELLTLSLSFLLYEVGEGRQSCSLFYKVVKIQEEGDVHKALNKCLACCK